MNLQQVIDAMVESFPDDPTQPSVVFSRLKNGNYYGSLVRYTESFGQGKQVLFKTQGDLSTVLSQLSAMLGVSDVDVSKRAVGGDVGGSGVAEVPAQVDGHDHADSGPDA